MGIIILQITGVLLFFIGTLVIGHFIRKNDSKQTAEGLSRVSHILFWLGIVLPELIGFFYPGLKEFDEIIGVPSFTGHSFITVIGWVMLLIGIYFLIQSNLALKQIGSGYASLKLTKNVVSTKVYDLTRNPMSFGYYLVYFSLSLIVGSTYLLVGSFIVMSVHIFNLYYFEQRELVLRHGDSYKRYIGNVPFIFPRLIKSKNA